MLHNTEDWLGGNNPFIILKAATDIFCNCSVLVVKLLAFSSVDPSSNPANVQCFCLRPRMDKA